MKLIRHKPTGFFVDFSFTSRTQTGQYSLSQTGCARDWGTWILPFISDDLNGVAGFICTPEDFELVDVKITVLSTKKEL